MRKFAPHVVDIEIVRTLYRPAEQEIVKNRRLGFQSNIVDSHAIGSIHHRWEFTRHFLFSRNMQ